MILANTLQQNSWSGGLLGTLCVMNTMVYGSNLNPNRLIQSIDQHTFLYYRKPSFEESHFSCEQQSAPIIQDTALPKPAELCGLRIDLAHLERDLISFVSTPSWLCICAITLRYMLWIHFTELVNLRNTKSSLQCAKYVMSHAGLGLPNLCACRYRCGGFHLLGPTEKEEPMNWLATISRVKQSIDEVSWDGRVPPPDCYQQKTISKEHQGGRLLGSFWIADRKSVV